MKVEYVLDSDKVRAQSATDNYAQRHGQDAAAALDEVLADYLEWEQQDYGETVQAVMEAYEDVKSRRTQAADDFLEELRAEHGFPR